MNYIVHLSKQISLSIAGNAGEFSSPEKLEVVEYGIYSLLSNIIKSLVIFFIAYLLGIFTYILIAFLSFGILRTFAYGVHARTSFGCFIFALAIYFPVVYFSLYYPLNPAAIYLLFATCFIFIVLYAPADVAENPILRVGQRLKLKVCAIIALAALFITTFYLAPITATIIALSCFAESLTLTPFFFFITKSRKGGEYLNEES